MQEIAKSPFSRCDFGFPSSDPDRERAMWEIYDAVQHMRTMLDSIQHTICNATPDCDMQILTTYRNKTVKAMLALDDACVYPYKA